jgi:hypothetical protein
MLEANLLFAHLSRRVTQVHPGPIDFKAPAEAVLVTSLKKPDVF